MKSPDWTVAKSGRKRLMVSLVPLHFIEDIRAGMLFWCSINCHKLPQTIYRANGQHPWDTTYHGPIAYAGPMAFANLELRHRRDSSTLHCPTSHGENSRFNSSIRLSRSNSKLINSLRLICVLPRCYMHRVRVWIVKSIPLLFIQTSVQSLSPYSPNTKMFVSWVHVHSFSLSYCISSRPLKNQLPVVKSTLHGF